MGAEQYTSEAAKARRASGDAAKLRAGAVRELAQLALADLAERLKDLPTDLPHSDSVKAAYDDLFKFVRGEDWERAEAAAFELGVMALGWSARMRLLELRESGDFDPRRRCSECKRLIPYTGRGRPRKVCEACS